MKEGIEKRDNESKFNYIKRITDCKNELDLDYSEWVRLIINKEYSSDNARKGYYIVKPLLDILEEEQINNINPKNKIQQVKDIIGELDLKKIEVRNKTNKLNRIKRDFSKTIEIANDIKEFLNNEIYDFPQLNYEPITNNSDNKLIVCIGDWHIGYVLKNYEGNSYNYKIAKQRLNKYLQQIKQTCNLYNIKDVIVCNLGDIIENTYLRNNQSYNCQFTFSEQIVKATQLLYSFISRISEFANVELHSVGGNHNRITGNKKDNLESDNINVVVVEMLKSFMGMANNKRITICKPNYKDDSDEFNVFDKKVKIFHGDERPKESIKVLSDNADIIIRGHFHNFSIDCCNNNYLITNGCLFGTNPYASKLGYKSKATQTLIIMNKNGIESIKNVELN